MDEVLQARIDEVRRRLPIADIIGRDTKLRGSGPKQRRCVCPFHQGRSASFAVYPGEGRAHCFGCQWHGDVIAFIRDKRGLSFANALDECEALAGISGVSTSLDTNGTGTVHRARNPSAPRKRERQLVEPIEVGRLLWRIGHPDAAAVRRYFRARGVPEAVLSDDRLAAFRFVGMGPVMPWEIGARPSSVPQAPALVALVRRPQWLVDETTGASRHGPEGDISGGDHKNGRLEFVPVGVHVTFLNPDGTGTMLRRWPWAKSDDPDPFMPKRKMLGPVGRGAVLLGSYDPQAPLYLGEGNETVLSGMALADAPAAAVGVATLSLDNLQGAPKLWRNRETGQRIWPLHALEPDPERGPFLVPGHRGPVVGLVDSDMSPLRGQKVVERKGGGIVERALTGAERATICAELFVKGWRRAGAGDVRALRAPMGMDFNDVVMAREEAAA